MSQAPPQKNVTRGCPRNSGVAKSFYFPIPLPPGRQEFDLQMSGLNHLRDFLGRKIRFLSSRTSAGLTPAGRTFVGAPVLAIPLEDFSAGHSYCGEFVEISTEWHHTRLGDDYHQLCAIRVPIPSDAGPRIMSPNQEQYPFENYPNFHGDYFASHVTSIEVFETVVTNADVNGDVVERIIYDSHIRFVAGAHEVVLTTEHGTILGEIELHAGLAGAVASYMPGISHPRVVMSV